MNTLPNEHDNRFVAVLNKKVPRGKLMNALGHMATGLSPALTPKQRQLLEYVDSDGGVHANISHYPFIVLQADNSNKIRALRQEVMKRNIPFIDFTDTMTVGTSLDQIELTKQTPEANLEYFGICMYGSTAELRECTKKFSLFS